MVEAAFAGVGRGSWAVCGGICRILTLLCDIQSAPRAVHWAILQASAYPQGFGPDLRQDRQCEGMFEDEERCCCAQRREGGDVFLHRFDIADTVLEQIDVRRAVGLTPRTPD